MPSISISKDYNIAAAVSPVYGGTGSNNSGSPYTSFIIASPSWSYFQPAGAILKGTMPATPPNNISAYMSNMLVKFGLNGFADGSTPDTTTFAQSTNVEDTTTLITIPMPANAAGLATWFWYFTCKVHYNPDPYPTAQSVIGTVGMPGSGADLILADTNIIPGTLYKIVLPIKWPTQWTY